MIQRQWYSIASMLIVLLLFATACNDVDSTAKGKVDSPVDKSLIEQRQEPNQSNSTPLSQSSDKPGTPEVIPDVDFELPYTIDSITIKDEILDKNTIVASYRDDNKVIFPIEVDEISTKMQIIQYNLTNNSFIVRYSTSQDRIINTLISVEDDLFWVEYPSHTTDEDNLLWEIKRMKRDDVKAKPELLTKGISEDQIAPPVLRFYKDQVSWIEKKITNKVVKSDAFIYNVKTDTQTKVATQLLNEQNKNRKGIFLDLQKPIEGGLLIKQSVFGNKKGQEIKYHNIVFYPDNASNPEVIAEDSQLVQDFNANEKWIILTKEGETELLDRKTKQLKYSLIHDEAPLGGYTPQFINNQVIYFQSPYIMAIDLATGNKRKIIDEEGLYTPIYQFGDTFTFTRIDVEKPEDGAELYFIHEK